MGGRHECKARQYSGGMVCHACGLAWDVNDPEPPACKKAVDGRSKTARAISAYEKEAKALPASRLPRELPIGLALDMERAHRAGGMQKAYRVMLDALDL